MCWSATVSMNTWLLVLFAAAVGYYNKYMNLAQTAFFLSFGVMQLVEYFLWSFPSLNKEFSVAGFLVVILQPLFSILQLSDPAQLKPLLAGYGLFAALSVYIANTPSVKFSSEVAKNGHLLWNWLPSNPVFIGLYMILLFTPIWLAGYKIGFVATITTLLISLYTFGTEKTWGSMWCWLSALFSFGVIGLSLAKAGTCSKP